MTSTTNTPATVRIVLLRHGDAGEPVRDPRLDARRPLSPKGRKQARRAGQVLDRLGLLPDEVWTSPLVRAVETADAAVAALSSGAAAPRRVVTTTLNPDASPERAARALVEPTAAPARGHARADKGRASRRASPPLRWLVGHQPHLARFAGYLAGAPAAALDVAKGAIVVLEFSGGRAEPGAGRLRVLLPPEAIKALRSR